LLHRVCVLVVLLAIAASISPRLARGDDLLTNPGFEEGTRGWQSINASLGGSLVAHSGAGALAVTSGEYKQVVDVWQRLSVQPGRSYEFTSWARVDDATVDRTFLRISWLDPTFGPISQSDSPWLTGASASYRFVSTGQRLSPPGAVFARLSVTFVSSGPFDALVDDASLTASATQPSGPSSSTPVQTPLPQITPGATPAAGGPSRTPTPTATPGLPDAEPLVFPALTNGGFEVARADGTAYGWRKVGGEAAVSGTRVVEGRNSLELSSSTTSTKWAYQAVTVGPSRWYEASASALSGASAEPFVRVSWYAAEDGTGPALDSADSPSGPGDSDFHLLSTGPVQAPAEARSVKVRLMLRPAASDEASALFDAVSLIPVPGPAQTGPGRGAARDVSRAQVLTRAGVGTVSGAGPSTEVGALRAFRDPVNVGPVSPVAEASPLPLTGKSSPLADILLALAIAIPMAGITAVLVREIARDRR